MLLNNNKSGASQYNPKISVIIPLYNHEKYIKEAIYSVLEQSFSDFELIVINDGSSDNSEDVVKTINDDRIKYFYQENQGAYSAINRGVRLAQGEYISILNSDDVYNLNRFEEVLKILQDDSSVYAVFSHIEFIDDEGNLIRFKRGAEDNWLGHNPETSFKGRNDIVLDLLAGNFLHTTSNLFCRKSVFNSVGYFSKLRYIHDYEFFLRLCYQCKIYIIEKPLLKYRFHSLNALNENYAVANFETGLVLANFLMNYDLGKVFANKDQKYDVMAKFFNSINTYDTDKMIMTLFLFGMKNNERDKLFEILTENPDNPFRKVCIDSLEKNRDMSLLKQALLWQQGQTELWWRKSEEYKNETICLNEEIRRRKRLNQMSEKEAIKWEFILKFSNAIDKVLPEGSKGRNWIQNLLKKLLNF